MVRSKHLRASLGAVLRAETPFQPKGHNPPTAEEVET